MQGRLSRYVPSIKENPADDTYPYVIGYEYNNLGQKTSVKIGAIDPESDCVANSTNATFDYATCELSDVVYDAEYAYYANGWLKSVKSGASDVADYTYDVVGNRERVTLGNGTYTDYDYDADPRYRLTTITHRNSSHETLAPAIDYTSTARDKVGNPKSMTDWTGTWTYGYDEMNRLTSATAPAPVPGQPAGGSGALAYGYDWVGNRIHPPSGANPMVYNKADQLTSWPGMRQYTYHGDGSLHEVKNAGGTTTLATYTYTPDGLLDTATFNGKTLTNTWDASQQRVGMTANGTDYEFVYDVTAGIPAVVEELKDGTPDVIVRYFREPGGDLISRVEGAATHYYHFDALGSTRLLTTRVGESVVVTDKYAYDAYGSLIAHDRFSGSIDQPYQYVGELGYYTHWMEPELGLLQLGVRFYDPEVGRFTQRDPVESSIADYGYAEGGPTGAVDPSGLYSLIYDPGPFEYIVDEMNRATEKAAYLVQEFLFCEIGCAAEACIPGVENLMDLLRFPEGRPPARWWKNPEYLKKLRLGSGTPGPVVWRFLKSAAKKGACILTVWDFTWCSKGCIDDFLRKWHALAD